MALATSLRTPGAALGGQARRPAPRRSVIVRSQNPLFPESLVNAFTVAIKQSPLNAAKKMMAVAQAGAYDEAAVKAKVDSLVADNPVVVFSWSGCPFCKKAKALLDGTGARYLAVELDEMDDGNAIRAELAKMTDRTSVPNVFIAGKSVGGCNDGPGVATLLSRGELTPMLQAAGAL